MIGWTAKTWSSKTATNAQIPEARADDEDYLRTSPRGSGPEVEMDTGTVGFLKVCSGRGDLTKTVLRDSEEVMGIIRDLGGSTTAYRR